MKYKCKKHCSTYITLSNGMFIIKSWKANNAVCWLNKDKCCPNSILKCL